MVPSAASRPRTVADYVEALERGEATAVSLLDQVLGRIAAHGDDAIFIALTAERARAEAQASDERRRSGTLLSPLDGVPVAWKDLFDTKGLPTTAGSRVYADSPPASRDSDVVNACTQLGMVCVGKTNLSEFAYSGLGLNPHYGTPKNPRIAGEPRVTGGSSSGSAAAVSAGLVPLAVGTDTAGSVRVPASFCGIAGYKASQNRYSNAGVFPLSRSLDSLGLFAHDVDDLIAMDAAMRGQSNPSFEPATAAALNVVVPETIVFDDLDAVVLEHFEAALEALGRAGVTITKTPFPVFQEVGDLFAKHGTLTVAEAATLHQYLLASDDAALMDQRVRTRMLTAHSFTAQDYITLDWARSRLQKAVGDTLKDRFLLFPTVAITAPSIAALEASDQLFVATNQMALRNTMLGSYLGTPGVNLPIGSDPDRGPIGMLVSAPFGHDERVLQAARAIETVLNPHD